MTVLEQYTYEAIKNAAYVVAEELPKITKALLAIQQELHEANGHYPDIDQSAMGPGNDEDLPF
jgi:hypothetical protein